jgi:hypothetical protein
VEWVFEVRRMNGFEADERSCRTSRGDYISAKKGGVPCGIRLLSSSKSTERDIVVVWVGRRVLH